MVSGGLGFMKALYGSIIRRFSRYYNAILSVTELSYLIEVTKHPILFFPSDTRGASIFGLQSIDNAVVSKAGKLTI